MGRGGIASGYRLAGLVGERDYLNFMEARKAGHTEEFTPQIRLANNKLYELPGEVDVVDNKVDPAVLPLVLATGAGAAAWVSVGLTVFGGMLLATIHGVAFVPFLYVQFQRLREATKRKAPQPALSSKSQQT